MFLGYTGGCSAGMQQGGWDTGTALTSGRCMVLIVIQRLLKEALFFVPPSSSMWVPRAIVPFTPP